jgi:CRP/FNR family cyclic AMP-dependent transcriptional regulator
MSTADEIGAILAAAPMFSELDDDAREALVAELRPIAFTPGQTIFARGDEGRELYLVLSGTVRLSVLTAEGRELSFMHAADGDIFGEIAMLDGSPRTADATAVKKTKAMSLSRAALDRVLETSPALAHSIIDFLCRRLREADMQLEGVALHRIEVRLARYLSGLCQQLDAGREHGTVDVELGMSQGELALLLGASRPKVNGALTMLEDLGIIERVGNKLRCDREELRAIAELE